MCGIVGVFELRNDPRELRRQRGRWLPREHGQRMAGLLDGRVERRDQCARLLDSGTQLFLVERRREPGLNPPPGDLQRLDLDLEIRLSDRETSLRAAQRDVVERDFGRDRHLDVAERRRARSERRLAHVQAGAILAEDWGLSARQSDAIRAHHEPERAERSGDLACLLNAADALAYTMGHGSGASPPPDVTAARLGLSPEEEAACLERARTAFALQMRVLA